MCKTRPMPSGRYTADTSFSAGCDRPGRGFGRGVGVALLAASLSTSGGAPGAEGAAPGAEGAARAADAPRESLASSPLRPAAELSTAPADFPAGAWALQLAVGVGNDSPGSDLELETLVSVNYAITDRLAWALPLPAFSYRFGRAGAAELLARGGVTGIGYSSIDGVIGTLDAGISGRAWLAPAFSLLAFGSSDWDFQTGPREEGLPSRTDELELRASLGFTWRVADRLSLSAGAGWAGEARVRETALNAPLERELAFGSLQALGYRPLPLVQVHLSPRFSLDAYAAWTVSLRDEPGRQFYLAGLGWVL